MGQNRLKIQVTWLQNSFREVEFAKMSGNEMNDYESVKASRILFRLIAYLAIVGITVLFSLLTFCDEIYSLDRADISTFIDSIS